ncbi:MAG: hypothetical protein ACFE7R_03725, partial [Candidatus Hodarchaeota archaeon]
MTETREAADAEELSALLREDSEWLKMPSPIFSCIEKKNRLALNVNLVMTMSIVLSFLLLQVEFIGTPTGAIPQGVSGLFQMPISIVSLIVAFGMGALSVLVFSSYLRFSICHSIGMQMAIRQLGIDSPEFPEAYRDSSVAPLVRATSSRLLFVLAIIISVLTPIVVRQYTGVQSTEIVDLLAIVNFGMVVICGGLVSEWSVRRTCTRYGRMSVAELKDNAEELIKRDRENALRWIRSQVRLRTGSTPSDEQLEPLVQLWYEEYLFRDADDKDSHKRLLESLTGGEDRSLPLSILLIALAFVIVWALMSL